MDSNFTDDKGRPAGGISTGIGYTIAWQTGPCPIEADGSQPGRNGAFLIEVLESCEARLGAYQDSEFACDENAEALFDLNNSIAALKSRLNRRKDAGTLGTHEKD
mgnify:CR=1 FL=1